MRRAVDSVQGRPVRARAITPGQVAEARKDLGRQLVAWRNAAGLTQHQLAVRVCYSRSTIANVEVGRCGNARKFWQAADREVGAAGALLAAFDQVDALAQDFAVQAAGAREQQRRQRFAQTVQPAPAPVPAGDGCGCGCGMTVARWGGRETRALREALRMSVRDFAEHLGVTTATVSGWEHPIAPAPPRLATQAILDQALKIADVDARTRFVLLLDHPAHDRHHTRTGDRTDSGFGTVVTALHRQGRSRSAS